MNKFTSIATGILIFGGSLFAQDKKKESEVVKVPPAVQVILDKTEKDVWSNRMDYDAKNMDVFSKSEKSLKVELEKIMKSDRPGKLQEAVAVQETLDGLRKNVTEKVDERARGGFKKEDGGKQLGNENKTFYTKEKFIDALKGKTWNWNNSGNMSFNKNGTLSPHNGTWTVDKGKIIATTGGVKHILTPNIENGKIMSFDGTTDTGVIFKVVLVVLDE